MSDSVMSIEDISKLYRIGVVGSRSFKADLNSWWQNTVLKKKTPEYDITNYSEKNRFGDYIWALKNVSFEIKQGQSWGIVGPNGAGKSTLLKILSRIIRPTEGRVFGTGKISSLLEVGIGFDAELSGRENIFLSGNLLGMTKNDIKRQLDDIVHFSGVGHFLDTPVKRYSSGMYVRLAFAVAAHLSPDILIVDEVLAVGDAEFQQMCLDKMKAASKTHGRTILFTSHNAQSILNLCSHAIYLDHGNLICSGEVKPVVNRYLSSFQKKFLKQSWPNPSEAPGNEYIRMSSIEFIPHLLQSSNTIDIRTPLTIKFKFRNLRDELNLMVGLHMFTYAGDCVFDVCCERSDFSKGILEAECLIPGNFLNDGSYFFSIIFVKDGFEQLYYFENCLHVDVEDYRGNIKWEGRWMGIVRPKFDFTLKQAEVA